jgi:hypothetical protein
LSTTQSYYKVVLIVTQWLAVSSHLKYFYFSCGFPTFFVAAISLCAAASYLLRGGHPWPPRPEFARSTPIDGA